MEAQTGKPSRPKIEPDISHVEKTTGATVEVVNGVTVFTVAYEDKDHSMITIASVYGSQTLYRIINPIFVDDALEYGTDRAGVDSADFRRLFPWSGLDVWKVEKKAASIGVKKSDVLCATPYSLVMKDASTFNGEGLSHPRDRFAVLIYDSEQLEEIPRTDGYFFKNPDNKKAALLGVIRIAEDRNKIDILVDSPKNRRRET